MSHQERPRGEMPPAPAACKVEPALNIDRAGEIWLIWAQPRGLTVCSSIVRMRMPF